MEQLLDLGTYLPLLGGLAVGALSLWWLCGPSKQPAGHPAAERRAGRAARRVMAAVEQAQQEMQAGLSAHRDAGGNEPHAAAHTAGRLYGGMTLRELKAFLDARGVNYSTCVEKSELRALVADAIATSPSPAVTATPSAGGADECAICLDVLQQPQTMLCGHRFCFGCVEGMHRFGGADVQVCPLCRGPMPDSKADQLAAEIALLLSRHDALFSESMRTSWAHGVSQPLQAQQLHRKILRMCRQALAINPEHVHVQHSLGCVLFNMGDWVGAEAAIRATIAMDPRHCNAHMNLALLCRQRGDMAGAETACRAALAANPLHVMAYRALGKHLAVAGDNGNAAAYKDAAFFYGSAIVIAQQDHPKAAEMYYDLGVALQMGGLVVSLLGEPIDAETAYHAAIAKSPHVGAHTNLGAILHDRGETAGALTTTRAALAIDPQNAIANTNLGIFLKMSGVRAGVEAAFRTAIATDPQYALAYASWGRFLRERGDTAGAKAVYSAGRARGLQDNEMQVPAPCIVM